MLVVQTVLRTVSETWLTDLIAGYSNPEIALMFQSQSVSCIQDNIGWEFVTNAHSLSGGRAVARCVAFLYSLFPNPYSLQ